MARLLFCPGGHVVRGLLEHLQLVVAFQAGDLERVVAVQTAQPPHMRAHSSITCLISPVLLVSVSDSDVMPLSYMHLPASWPCSICSHRP